MSQMILDTHFQLNGNFYYVALMGSIANMSVYDSDNNRIVDSVECDIAELPIHVIQQLIVMGAISERANKVV